jgi:hypothetical protein
VKVLPPFVEDRDVSALYKQVASYWVEVHMPCSQPWNSSIPNP